MGHFKERRATGEIIDFVTTSALLQVQSYLPTDILAHQSIFKSYHKSCQVLGKIEINRQTVWVFSMMGQKDSHWNRNASLSDFSAFTPIKKNKRVFCDGSK